MKYNIITKFIAIALCAAALLAAAAGGLGIMMMAEYGLYEQTLEDLYKDRLEDNAYWLAQQIAQNYASTNLGGCPEEMLGHYFYLNAGDYGYTLQDSGGQVLDHVPVSGEGKVYEYSFTISGSYMNVVASTPVETQPQRSAYDRIPQEGAEVYGIYYCGLDGGGESYGSDDSLGMLEHNGDGCAVFTAFHYGFLDADIDMELTEIAFYDAGGELIYAISDVVPIGLLSVNENGIVHFLAYEATENISSADTEVPAATEALDSANVQIETASNGPHHFSYYDNELGCEISVEYTWEVMPEYRVNMTVLPQAISYNYDYTFLPVLYACQNLLPIALVVGLILFAITAVYLCCAAGRRPGTDEVRPAGLNRLPLDLYLCGGGLFLCGLLFVCVEAGGTLIRQNVNVGLGCMALMGYMGALTFVAFCFAFAAQAKIKGGYWLRHMILGWSLGQVLRFIRWLGRGLKWLRNGIRGVFNLLPVIWQWLVTAALMVLCLVVSGGLALINHGFFRLIWSLVFILCVIGCAVMIVYGGWCFGTLLKGARAMSRGNLDHKVDTGHLCGSFREFGVELNCLAEGAKIAAQRQMKSERMKTELITNVSHDIKTPLTSIINYVDLLKKPHAPEETEQYLEVLDRQSQRLKKLIEDLMEMSKASTGNLAVDLGQVDVVEAVNQALGEFSDKLAAVNLMPVFRHPEEPVIMRADGRLVWRVLSNLLGNACKYALPDTRLYIDLMVLQGNAVIAIKNISREQLNVNAEELMERFVRGDASRNTEGSGLGLNIAQSLVQLQQGQMHLMVDGDLFKVTLIFPLD